jgi:hypothetical protein
MVNLLYLPHDILAPIKGNKAQDNTKMEMKQEQEITGFSCGTRLIHHHLIHDNWIFPMAPKRHQDSVTVP